MTQVSITLSKLRRLSWNHHNSPPHPPLHKGRLKSPKFAEREEESEMERLLKKRGG